MSLLDVRRSSRLLAALFLVLPAGLSAQSAPAYAAPDSAPASRATAQIQSAPAPMALAIAPSGITTRARTDSTDAQRLAASTARMQDDTRVGKNLALVLVGAAGVIVGVLVGDTEGTVIAVGGAAIGLYGLYRMLR